MEEEENINMNGEKVLKMKKELKGKSTDLRNLINKIKLVGDKN